MTAPAPPAAVRGTIDVPVRVRTPGPAEYPVRTIMMQPGETTGRQQHPGTGTPVVEPGAVTVPEEDGDHRVRPGLWDS